MRNILLNLFMLVFSALCDYNYAKIGSLLVNDDGTIGYYII